MEECARAPRGYRFITTEDDQRGHASPQIWAQALQRTGTPAGSMELHVHSSGIFTMHAARVLRGSAMHRTEAMSGRFRPRNRRRATQLQRVAFRTKFTSRLTVVFCGRVQGCSNHRESHISFQSQEAPSREAKLAAPCSTWKRAVFSRRENTV